MYGVDKSPGESPIRNRLLVSGLVIVALVVISAWSGIPSAIWGDDSASERKTSSASPDAASARAGVKGAREEAVFPPDPERAPYSTVKVEGLEGRIARELDSLSNKTRLSVFVADPSTRQVLFARDETKALVPASNMKIVTAAAAYDLMGPEWNFETSFAAIDIEDGVAKGGLWIRGSGDPSASWRFNDGDFQTGLDAIAAQLARAGLREVQGPVMADRSVFAGPQRGPKWPTDSYVNWWMVEVSPLVFNDNQIRIKVTQKGTDLSTSFIPAVGYGRIINRAKVSKKKRRRTLSYDRAKSESVFTVRGSLPIKGKGHMHDVNVADGTGYYLAGLLAALRRKGVKVDGARVSKKSVQPDETRLEVLHVEKTPLAKITAPMLKSSQNLYAEIIYRQIGLTQKEEGSFVAAGEAVTGWLKRERILEAGTAFGDGSGLSRANAVSSRQIAGILSLLWDRRALREPFREALAEPASTGTLRKRMGPLKGRVFAKTGTLSGVSALSGYVKARDGRWLVFSGIFNRCQVGEARRVQNRICEALANF